jgi:hypothetical protein
MPLGQSRMTFESSVHPFDESMTLAVHSRITVGV